MSFRVRNSLNGQEETIKESKLLEIKALRKIIKDKFSVDPPLQRLFFKGKLLEDVSGEGQNLTLFDYSVGAADVILLMPKQVLGDLNSANNQATVQEDGKGKVGPGQDKVGAEEVKDALEPQFPVGEFVDAKCSETGAWFIAKVNGVGRDENGKVEYKVRFHGYEKENWEQTLTETELRKVANTRIPLEDLKVGDTVFVNYNLDNPGQLGFWYDAKVEEVRRTTRTVICTVKDKKGCRITDINEIYKCETPDFSIMDCEECKKNSKRKCFQCGCRKCGGKEDEESIIMCDECNGGYHIKCLGLSAIPDDDEWFCPDCKNVNDIVGAGGKAMKAKARKSGSGRDWGKGHATTGRNKECNIVGKDHFGPIPGIEVGMNWQLRVQASEEGVHRPLVTGICGSGKSKNINERGCQSICLAGGYEDDVDNGDSFYYTGSGGRDLSGNKRTAAQSSDQKLERFNLALAWSCAARPVSSKGGDAGKNWKEGKPVRVLRSYKAKKHSEYAPEEGVRYDGIYKVKRYWQEAGESGFKVWRFEFIRDDPSPAPWTPEEDEDEEVCKKARKVYEMSPEWRELIQQDTKNKKMWDQVLEKEVYSRMELLDQVKSNLTCQICFELPNLQVTTDCGHNICQECLVSSFEAEVYSCPSCRADLDKNLDTNNINLNLKAVLDKLFPRL